MHHPQQLWLSEWPGDIQQSPYSVIVLSKNTRKKTKGGTIDLGTFAQIIFRPYRDFLSSTTGELIQLSEHFLSIPHALLTNGSGSRIQYVSTKHKLPVSALLPLHLTETSKLQLSQIRGEYAIIEFKALAFKHKPFVGFVLEWLVTWFYISILKGF